MNVRYYAVLAAIVLMSLSSCKTMEGKSLSMSPAQGSVNTPVETPVKPGTLYAPRIEEDTAYMAYVQRMAWRRGVYLRWINKPQKRIVDPSQQQ